MTSSRPRHHVARHASTCPTRTIDFDIRGLFGSFRQQSSTWLSLFATIVLVAFAVLRDIRLVRPFREGLGRAHGVTTAARAGLPNRSAENATGGIQRASVGEKVDAAVRIGLTYSNPAVLEGGGCSVTVIFVEPSLSEAGLWALESAAANVRPAETACFLLQTSVCRLQRGGNMTESQAAAKLGESLLSRLADKPFFRSHVERGSVRLSVVNHAKYGLVWCDNFKGISRMWLDLRYWGSDEFIAGVDSDLVLTIQADAVLCHPLDVDRWRPFAFVGAPWPPMRFHLDYFVNRWKKWHKNAAQALGHNSTLPLYPTRKQFQSDPNKALVGNGGLSLRSRGWVRRALAYCPSSTLPRDDPNLRGAICRQDRIFNEDMHIGLILRGMAFNNFTGGTEGPPRLPSVSEAAMFAGETMSLARVKELYNLNDAKEFERVADRLWWSPSGTEDGEGGLDRYQRMLSEGATEDEWSMIVPVGLHKPWHNPWIELHLLVGEAMEKECPYLNHIIPQIHKEDGLTKLAEIRNKTESRWSS